MKTETIASFDSTGVTTLVTTERASSIDFWLCSFGLSSSHCDSDLVSRNVQCMNFLPAEEHTSKSIHEDESEDQSSVVIPILKNIENDGRPNFSSLSEDTSEGIESRNETLVPTSIVENENMVSTVIGTEFVDGNLEISSPESAQVSRKKINTDRNMNSSRGKDLGISDDCKLILLSLQESEKSNNDFSTPSRNSQNEATTSKISTAIDETTNNGSTDSSQSVAIFLKKSSKNVVSKKEAEAIKRGGGGKVTDTKEVLLSSSRKSLHDLLNHRENYMALEIDGGNECFKKSITKNVKTDTNRKSANSIDERDRSGCVTSVKSGITEISGVTEKMKNLSNQKKANIHKKPSAQTEHVTAKKSPLHDSDTNLSKDRNLITRVGLSKRSTQRDRSSSPSRGQLRRKKSTANSRNVRIPLPSRDRNNSCTEHCSKSESKDGTQSITGVIKREKVVARSHKYISEGRGRDHAVTYSQTDGPDDKEKVTKEKRFSSRNQHSGPQTNSLIRGWRLQNKTELNDNKGDKAFPFKADVLSKATSKNDSNFSKGKPSLNRNQSASSSRSNSHHRSSSRNRAKRVEKDIEIPRGREKKKEMNQSDKVQSSSNMDEKTQCLSAVAMRKENTVIVPRTKVRGKMTKDTIEKKQNPNEVGFDQNNGTTDEKLESCKNMKEKPMALKVERGENSHWPTEQEITQKATTKNFNFLSKRNKYNI